MQPKPETTPKTRAVPTPPPVYAVPVATKSQAHAIRALINGTATPEEQQKAITWIINEAALTYDMPWRPGDTAASRDTDFACGRMFVGQQIVRLSKLSLTTIEHFPD